MMPIRIVIPLSSVKMIWDVPKDTFFRRWRAQEPRVSDFDQSITQYIEMSNKVQQMDTMSNQEFVLLDCTILKLSAIAHCEEWQNRFHNMLMDIATTKLNTITDSLATNTKRCLLHVLLHTAG